MLNFEYNDRRNKIIPSEVRVELNWTKRGLPPSSYRPIALSPGSYHPIIRPLSPYRPITLSPSSYHPIILPPSSYHPITLSPYHRAPITLSPYHRARGPEQRRLQAQFVLLVFRAEF